MPATGRPKPPARRGVPRAVVVLVAVAVSAGALAGCSATPVPAGAAAPGAKGVASDAPSAGRDSAAPSGPVPAGGAAAARTGALAARPPSQVVPPASADGLPPVVHRIATSDKVVFLTIDDGWTKDPALPGVLRTWGVPVTVFATNDAIKDDLEYVRRLRAAGASVQNHTLTHPDLRRASQSAAQREICGASDIYERKFGERPWLLRPPFGNYDDSTRRAAKACGIDYLVLWDVSQPGRWLRYADGSALKPGDIVLLHFVPHLSEYLEHTLRVIKAAGLSVGRLEDYLPRRGA